MKTDLMLRPGSLALVAGFPAFAGPAAAQYSSIKGEGPCPAGTVFTSGYYQEECLIRARK